jgi:hypothetical protein
MMPWIISHDLMRANEEERVRATRFAHHRADTYRRPGPLLTSLLQAWMSKVPIPRRADPAPAAPGPAARDTLRLVVSDLGQPGRRNRGRAGHPEGASDDVRDRASWR